MSSFLVVCALLSPAQLCCPSPVHQAGRVATGTPITHSFHVRNDGRDELQLLRVKTACGCLQTALPVTRLRPGEQAALRVSVNTVTQPGGAGTWRATVHYRQRGEERELPLAIQATLVPVLTIRPATLRFNVTGPLQGRFTLIDHRDKPATITAVAATSPHLTVKPGAAVREDGVWVRPIHVTVTGDMAAGQHEGVVKLFVEGSREVTVPYTVIKRRASNIQVRPAAVEIVAAKGEPLPSRIVQIGRADDKPVAIERVETGRPELRCTWMAGPGERVTLRFEAGSGLLTEGGYKGEVRVHLRVPAGQVVTIPVSCLAR